MRIKAGCKVNLGLRITGKRPDGLHTLESIFYPLPYPCDTLFVQVRKSAGLRLNCPVIDPDNNTIVKAYSLFSAASPACPGVEVNLIKRIPQGAGLGGGSSDAACFLLWLNSVSPNPLSRDKILDIAFKTGADVPFFLSSRPAYVAGVGEKIHILHNTGLHLFLVLVWPQVQVSTKWAFSRYDSILPGNKHPAIPAGSSAVNVLTKHVPKVKNQTLWKVDKRGEFGPFNDLEKVVFPNYPSLRSLKDKFLELGAFASCMSGSGSSILGLFKDIVNAQRCAVNLRKKYGHVYCMGINCPDGLAHWDVAKG